MNNIALAQRVFLAWFFLMIPHYASAHVFFDHSDPRVGAEVKDSPKVVKIWYDGELEPVFSTIRVLDSSGKEVNKGDAWVDGTDHTLLEVTVPALPHGQYEAVWQALSRDGHSTEGKFKFKIR